MEAKASIISVPESDTIINKVVSLNSLLNFYLQGELQVWSRFFGGLSLRIEAWFHAQVSRKRAMISLGLTFLLGLIVSGIVEGEVYDIWKRTILPWLTKSNSFSNGVLLLLIMGWVSFTLACIVLFGVYGAGRRKIGQLETVKQQNEVHRQEITQLNIQVSEFTHQLTQLRDEATQRQGNLVQVTSELELLRKETKLLDLLRNTDRELFIMFTQLSVSDEIIQNFVEVIFRRTFELWGLDKVHRGGIFVPDINTPEFLTVMWDYGLGSASRRWDRWYIGAHDPVANKSPRGIAGNVYVKGEDRVNSDISSDPDFVDMHRPKRAVLPYRSTIHAVIHPDDEHKKLGVLCLDSMSYEFTQHDLTLVKQVATRIGWLMQTVHSTSLAQNERKQHEH